MSFDTEIEQQIVDKGLTAPRVTLPAIESKIIDTQFHVFPGSCLTVCCLTLENGFNTVGHSACASPENFNEEIGRNIALANAKREIWALEGYLLKQRLHEAGETA